MKYLAKSLAMCCLLSHYWLLRILHVLLYQLYAFQRFSSSLWLDFSFSSQCLLKSSSFLKIFSLDTFSEMWLRVKNISYIYVVLGTSCQTALGRVWNTCWIIVCSLMACQLLSLSLVFMFATLVIVKYYITVLFHSIHLASWMFS